MTGIWRASCPAEFQGSLSASVVAGVKMRCFAVSATSGAHCSSFFLRHQQLPLLLWLQWAVAVCFVTLCEVFFHTDGLSLYSAAWVRRFFACACVVAVRIFFVTLQADAVPECPLNVPRSKPYGQRPVNNPSFCASGHVHMLICLSSSVGQFKQTSFESSEKR